MDRFGQTKPPKLNHSRPNPIHTSTGRARLTRRLTAEAPDWPVGEMKLPFAVTHLLRMTTMAWFVIRGLRHRHRRPSDRHAALRGAAPSTLSGGCFDGPLSWRGVDGELRVNGQTFHLKGTHG